MLPQMIVFQKQQRSLVLVMVPVMLILRDLYFESYSALISLALRFNENALPLKL